MLRMRTCVENRYTGEDGVWKNTVETV